MPKQMTDGKTVERAKSWPGKKVLVTRPIRQAKTLCAAIEQLNAIAVGFPALEIAPPSDPKLVRSILAQMEDCLWVVFVSANAVEFANRCLDGRMQERIKRPKVAAVGGATQKCLEECGIKADLTPDRFNSEALLAMPQLADVAGARIMIVRGDGGRALLGDTLADRGADIVYADVYRRLQPNTDVRSLMRMWEREGIDVVTVTSCELLDNLISMLGVAGAGLLKRTPMVVASQRIKEKARGFGVENIRVAAAVSNTAIIDAVYDSLCG